MNAVVGECSRIENGDQHQVDAELLLRQITELVINERLICGKTLPEDRMVNFMHPAELKVRLHF